MVRISKSTFVLSLALSLVLSTLMIHLDYRPLYRLFKRVRVLVYRKFNRSIIHIEWDKKSDLPLVNYGRVKGKFLGKHVNPLIVAQILLEKVLPEDTLEFLKLSKKLADLFGGDGLYRYPHPQVMYKMKGGWVSAFTQAASGEVFFRAWKISGDSSFLNLAYKVTKYLTIPIKMGGVSYINKERIWFEEYASKDGPEPRVLNGMMWTLIHIKNMWELSGDTLFLDLFKKGEFTLRDSLENYDLNGWSYYDRVGTPSSEGYQIMHVQLCESFFKETGFQDYKNWAKRWKLGLHNPLRARVTWAWFFLHLIFFFTISYAIFQKLQERI